MLTIDKVRAAFPGIDKIADARLRTVALDVWDYVSQRNQTWSDVARLPLHPTMPIAKHGNLIKHVVAMVRLSEAIVPLYAELWNEKIDLDLFRTACYAHDAAKVIEFTETAEGLSAIAGYNHAIEAGRIVRQVAGPEELAHMCEAHSFSGPLVMPRTREAQLFLLLDPMCLDVFPEKGPGVFERHLKANGWEAPATLERYTPHKG